MASALISFGGSIDSVSIRVISGGKKGRPRPVEGALVDEGPIRSPIECGRNKKELGTGATVPPPLVDAGGAVDDGAVDRKRLLLAVRLEDVVVGVDVGGGGRKLAA